MRDLTARPAFEINRSPQVRDVLILVACLILLLSLRFIVSPLVSSLKCGTPRVFPPSIEYVDSRLLFAVNPGLLHPLGLLAFSIVTSSVNHYLVVAIGIFLYLIGNRKAGISVFLSLILGALIISVAKGVFCRFRPYEVYDIVVASQKGMDYSFPSGHAGRAFALATILSDSRRKAVKAMIFFWASSVAFSRMYLGVHYPSDVLVGAVLGWAIGRLALALGGRVFPPAREP